MSAEMGGLRPSGSKRAVTVGTAVAHLLKTPTAQLAVNGGSQHPDKRRAGGHGPTLADQIEHQLLPTPSAALATGGQTSRSGDRIGEPLLPSIAKSASNGGLTPVPSPAGSESPDGPLPGQLSLAELESA